MGTGSLSLKRLSNKSTSYIGSQVTVAGQGDPYWSNVSLLLLGNGAGNNSVYTDRSGTVTLTPASVMYMGNYSPSNSIAGSVFLDGNSTSYITATSGSHFAPGNNDFTVEAWINMPWISTNGGAIFSTLGASNGVADGIFFGVVNSAGSAYLNITIGAGGNGASNKSVQSPAAIPFDQWTHVAATRQANKVNLWINGISVGSIVDNHNLTATNTCLLGKQYTDNTNMFVGNLTNLRFVNGTAVYTAPFSPSYNPLLSISGTKLLMLGDTAQIVDSTRKNNIASVGNVVATGAMSKFSNSSLYFDGAGDYLSIRATPELAIGSTNFTLEMWFFPLSTAVAHEIVDIYDGNSAGRLMFQVNSGGTVTVAGASGSAIITTTGTVTANNWHHIAVVRNNGVLSIYINGISAATPVTNNTNFTCSTGNITVGIIGSDTVSSPLYGYIDDLRLTKGVARYTQNFSVPQYELPTYFSSLPYDPSWANTSLLLHGDGSNGANNATFVDSSSNNFIPTITGAPAQGSASPFAVSLNNAYSPSVNGGSIYFNGSTYLQYGTATDTALSFGTGDFTIECWFNAKAAVSGGSILMDARSAVNASPWAISFDGSSNVYFYDGSTYTVSSPVSLNTWYHVAVSRVSGTLRIFLNGALGYSGANSVSLNRAGQFTIGARVVGDALFTGYISNIRVLKGTGLYTTAFTPPTAPLTAITNTQLLLAGNNAAIIDSTTKNNLAVVGNTATMVAVNKFGGSSIYFDGVGDYIQAANTTDFQLGTGDFTIEAWVNVTSVARTNYICIQVSGSGTVGSQVGVGLAINSSGGVAGFFYSGTTQTPITSAGSLITANTWYHVAFMRQAGVLYLFVNGTMVTSTAGASSINSLAITDTLSIGRYIAEGDTSAFQGYMDDFRYTKGVARYSISGFVPPSTAFPDR